MQDNAQMADCEHLVPVDNCLACKPCYASYRECIEKYACSACSEVLLSQEGFDEHNQERHPLTARSIEQIVADINADLAQRVRDYNVSRETSEIRDE